MKKLTIVFAVLVSFAMAGCLVEDNSVKIAKLKQEVEELKKEKQGQEERKSDIFEKNIECQKYFTDLKKENYTVTKIFYSPKESSCLYVSENRDGSIKSLVDFFTREELIRYVNLVGGYTKFTIKEKIQEWSSWEEFEQSGQKTFEEYLVEYQK